MNNKKNVIVISLIKIDEKIYYKNIHITYLHKYMQNRKYLNHLQILKLST